MAASMHWNATDGRYHEALRRLAVVLLTLAVISEGLARRSLPVRCFVLWLLFRAEVLARGFAATAGAPPLLPFARGVCRSGSPEQAARLAGTFRVLANLFFALSRQVRHWSRLACLNDPVRLCGERRNAELAGRQGVMGQRIYADTS
jgi:hypothetical protein